MNVLFLILKTLRMRSGYFAALMIRIQLRQMDVSVKETTRKPLNSSKLASRTHKMFIVNMDEEKFYALNKKYNIPENCHSMVVPKCNEIWKCNLTSL